jgi:hypothetical protein
MSKRDLINLWSNKEKRDAYIRDDKNYDLIEDALARIDEVQS